jgi:hypothetical protein
LLRLVKTPVPPAIGIGLVVLASLPAVNYLIPTVTAVALLLLFTASLFLARGNFALPHKD